MSLGGIGISICKARKLQKKSYFFCKYLLLLKCKEDLKTNWGRVKRHRHQTEGASWQNVEQFKH